MSEPTDAQESIGVAPASPTPQLKARKRLLLQWTLMLGLAGVLLLCGDVLKDLFKSEAWRSQDERLVNRLDARTPNMSTKTINLSDSTVEPTRIHWQQEIAREEPAIMKAGNSSPAALNAGPTQSGDVAAQAYPLVRGFPLQLRLDSAANPLKVGVPLNSNPYPPPFASGYPVPPNQSQPYQSQYQPYQSPRRSTFVGQEWTEAMALAQRIQQMPEPQKKIAAKQLFDMLLVEFDQRHQQQVAYLEQLKTKLDQTGKILSSRAERKNEIVQRRFRELLGERDPLAWDYVPDPSKADPSSVLRRNSSGSPPYVSQPSVAATSARPAADPPIVSSNSPSLAVGVPAPFSFDGLVQLASEIKSLRYENKRLQRLYKQGLIQATELQLNEFKLEAAEKKWEFRKLEMQGMSQAFALRGEALRKYMESLKNDAERLEKMAEYQQLEVESNMLQRMLAWYDTALEPTDGAAEAPVDGADAGSTDGISEEPAQAETSLEDDS